MTTLLEKRPGTPIAIPSPTSDCIPLSLDEDRKLVRKIDFHLLCPIILLYMFTFMDRVNIGNGVVFGLREDLGLKGMEYNIALSVFFAPYILFELPSNILLKKFSPRIWLSFCMFGFGTVTTLQGLVKNYAGLLVCRVFLGVFEAGTMPGCLYLMASWYRRDESQKRISAFFLSTAIAGSSGGLLAYLIGMMHEYRGYSGWRWIFIIEGAITVIFSIVSFFTFPNFPEDATWLTSSERSAVFARIRDDVGSEHEEPEKKVTWKLIGTVLSDYKVMCGGGMYLGLMVSAYGYAYFAPTIIKSFGYSAVVTQLRSIPVWVAGIVMCLTFGYFADHYKSHFYFIIPSIAIALSGFFVLLTVHDNVTIQYFALFPALCGTITVMPLTLGWFSTNLQGHAHRQIGTAWQVGVGNVGGIVSTFIFRSQDSPKWTLGYSVAISFVGLAVLSSIVYYIGIKRENRRARAVGGYQYYT